MTDDKKKKVQFKLINEIFNESDSLSEFLHEARINNFLQHKADKMRIERLLSPILTKEYRALIQTRNQQ
jgi:hypothetical protein